MTKTADSLRSARRRKIVANTPMPSWIPTGLPGRDLLVGTAGHYRHRPGLADPAGTQQRAGTKPARMWFGVGAAASWCPHVPLFGVHRKDEVKADVPPALPAPRWGMQRIAVATGWLLDQAIPLNIQGMVAGRVSDLGPSELWEGIAPADMSLFRADGSRVLLRSTMRAAPTTKAPEEEPHPDWRSPTDLQV